MGLERLGRYTVLKHLASGGMADVLLARGDGIEGFERHVVVKRIRSEHAKDQRFIQMFLDEARVAASLHHANIVQVHDIGESRGEYFFAMEYIHGEDLRKMLSVVSKNKQHMPLGHVCAIVSAAAAGLHYAHDRRGSDKKPLNIVHRDVSPSNIIVTYDGSVKVVDFGIAKAAMRQVETRSGSLKGKVSYMSPEQCKGEDIDRRSDVYALGVLLYELATTTRLFKGENDYLLMDAIVNGKVPLPRVRRPDLPNELAQIMMRALSVDPNRRYQSAEELRVAIDQFAAKAQLTASQSSLASYMKKVFGEKPEPWLDIADAVGSDEARKSWSDLPEQEEPTASGEELDRDKTRDGSKKGKRTGPAAALAAAAAIPARETRTSMSMGWEQHPTPVPGEPARAGRGKLVALAAIPLVGIAAVLVWQLGLKSHDGGAGSSHVAAATIPAPAPGPTIVHIETPAPAVATAPTVAPIETPPAPAPTSPPAAARPPAAVAVAPPTPAPATKGKTSRHSTTKLAAAVAPAPPATPVVAAPVAPTPAPVVAPAPPPPPAPPQVAAAVPPPAPAPPAPAQVEASIAQLSPATVQMIASDHGSQLAKCESAAGDVHGEISVAFQIDGTGKVVKSQLSTSVKNPKLIGCILKAVTSWKFPKPPTGAAKGVYSIDYQ